MKPVEYDVYSQGELPNAIDHGHRRVEAKVGWKWVQLRHKHSSKYLPTPQWSKVSRKVWDELRKEEVKDPKVNGLITQRKEMIEA